MICTPAIGLVFWFVMARCIPYYKQLQAKLDCIALICREGLSGARVVRAFVREDHERERFAQPPTTRPIPPSWWASFRRFSTLSRFS